MLIILDTFLIYYNKFFSSLFVVYLLFIVLNALLFFFYLAYNSFIRILIFFPFLVSNAILLSNSSLDFFGAFSLAAELPVALVLLVFYFHKNALQVDNLYKYNKTNNINNLNYVAIIILVVLLFMTITSTTGNNFLFYNFLSDGCYSASSKNDFIVIFNVLYNLNYAYILFFAILIFYVSLLVILISQLQKSLISLNGYVKNNFLFLRKQNMLKQSVFRSKLKFFNKTN